LKKKVARTRLYAVGSEAPCARRCASGTSAVLALDECVQLVESADLDRASIVAQDPVVVALEDVLAKSREFSSRSGRELR
jgi:uncharacterized metal-binding protein